MSPSLYAVLWEQTETGALAADAQRRILDCNPAAERILGTRGSGLIGKTVLEATLSYDILNMMNAAQSTGQAQRQEIRRPGEPTPKTLRVRILPLDSASTPSGNHAAPRFMLLIDDVTELRRLETVRRDFVANVSHELRTPLASIRAMAETLQDGALHDGEVAERFVQIILSEVERLTRLLEDLLVLSKAESQQPERAPFLLDTLLREVTERFQPQAEKAEVRLSHELPERLEVTANRDQIEQAFVNLVENAIKYTQSGGSVWVTAEAFEGGVMTHVRDTGVGIMSQDLPRIFERFYRADKGRQRPGGTGLGLAIVKHIIETHGGSVTVQSEYGRGSVFTVTLLR